MADHNRSDSNMQDIQANSSPVPDKPQALPGQDASPPTTPPEPWFVDVDEEGYLFAKDWDGGDWPTRREHYEYDWMSIDEKVQHLLEHNCLDEESLLEQHQICKPEGGWDAALLAHLESLLGRFLDEPVSRGEMCPDDQFRHSWYGVGGLVLDQFSLDEQDRLGLWLVEGEHPGSDFTGVCLDGDIGELNRALAKRGANIVVRDPYDQ